MKTGSLSTANMRQLVTHCSKVALHLLVKKHVHEFNAGFNRAYKLHDLATDAIAPLFICDKSGEIPLKKALDNWDQTIADAATAYYFFSKIISNRIEQEIAKKLKEADPFFGKILRSFNYLVEKGRLNKANWFGVVYLLDANCSEIKQKPMDLIFLENLPSKYFQGPTEKIVAKLFEYVKSETDYFPAIPLNALIRKIKHVNASFLQNSNPDSLSECFEENLDVKNIIEKSLQIVNMKIDKFYYGKGKLNLHETRAFKKVMAEFSVDLQDGGISRGLYEYLFPHLKNLSKDEFYHKYHQSLDYLLRLLKKEIAKKLES